MFTLVLHTHLPWLAHHGRWPVGEEWLYQSWSAAYLPLFRVLRELAGEDRRGLITLGMTPVVNAQLDDPYCLDGMHHWVANWRLRATEATSVWCAPGSKSAHYQSCAPEALRAFGIRECIEADQALEDFAALWRHGGSPLLRGLIDAGAVELLGGPLAHPFQPLLNPRLREFALREGLADAWLRLGARPTGIWAPECAYAPAWSTTTPPRESATSWWTARHCTVTPRWAGRSATPTWSHSGVTFRSATGCGHRNPATRDTRPTAISTPTTI
ncbi:glycosyl hydrolase 57 family protein [Mycobacterium kansasii 732]|nr:glycosyl hydrolase 57 family protein [Mycobacterium kansasii 732]